MSSSPVVIRASREFEYRIFNCSEPLFAAANQLVHEIVGSDHILAAVDRNVDAIYGNEIRESLHSKVDCLAYELVDPTEQSKNLPEVGRICSAAAKAGLGRRGIFLAVGGGVTLDVVGLAASIFRRGVRVLRVPTTLIGQTDVVVGVKHGVNLSGHKNLLGSFHPAFCAINDKRFLATLPKREIAGGIAEIVKMAIIRDATLLEIVENYGPELVQGRFQTSLTVADEVLERAIRGMAEEIQDNLFEDSWRRSVDLGHTFSPILESKSGFQLPHGEAVALDLLLSTLLAANRGIGDPRLYTRLMQLYRRIDLPVTQDICTAHELFQSLDSIRAHRGGELNLVVPTTVGEIDYINNLSFPEVEKALAVLARSADYK